MKINGRSVVGASAILLTLGILSAIAAGSIGTGNEIVTKVTNKDVSKYTAAQLNADMGLGLDAGDSFDAAAAKTAKDRGFGTVKVTGDWSGHISADGSSTVDADWLAGIKTTVDAAAAQDMYIVLELDGETDDNTAVWQQIAESFAKYDRKLIFAGDFTADTTADKTDAKKPANAVKAIRGVKGNADRVLLVDAADWYSTETDNYMMVAVSGESFAISGDVFTEEDGSSIREQFGKAELDWADAGIPVVVDGAAESSFAKAEENTKWAESFGLSAKKLGVPVLFDTIGGKEDKAAAKLLDIYKKTSTTGTVLEHFDAEEGTKVLNSGYADLKAGEDGKYSCTLTLDEMTGDADADSVTAVRFTGSCGFSAGDAYGKDVIKNVLTVDEIGDSIIITSESAGGRIKYEVLGTDHALEPDTKYLQFTAPDDSGNCYARAVMMVKYEDIADVDEVKFTFDLNGQKASVKSEKYYRAVSQQGSKLEADEDYVFVAAVISGVPEDQITGLTISDIELVKN